MVTPRCPFCNTAGLNNVEAVPFGPALLVFCKNCGAIHGVVANPKNAPIGAAGGPAAGRERPQNQPIGATSLAGPDGERPQNQPIGTGTAATPGRRPIGEDSGPKPEPVKVPPGKMTPERMAAMAPLLNRGSTNYRIIRPLTDDEANGE